jgi:serine/threonine protein kinase
MIGKSLGPYHVVAKLGEGGMGEVYRATDTHLKRAVAIKVLPASVAGDSDRLARFQREAEVLAALNHPNIAGIYGLEKTADITALVMELVDGDDLSQRIARLRASGASAGQAGMPLDEALPIAKQIAEALEAAHEAGIVHRDLKPANIKVRADGTVKVLDFGLAKALDQGSGIGDQGSGGLANSPTITSPAMTQMGMILGTAAYMSPEQAKGRPVDRRTDIFAFGCVLYEMLTGRRAFDGDDVTEVLGAVVRLEPDWTRLPAACPPAIQRLLRLCLEKNVRNRRSSATDVRLDLEEAARAPQATTPTALAPPRHARLPWIAAAALLLSTVTLSLLYFRAAPPAEVMRF